MFQLKTKGLAGRALPSAATVLVAIATLGSALAQAQQAVRQDPLQACDAVVQTLQGELASAALMYGRTGTATVRFRWRGDAVVDVVARGGVPEYRPALRRALRALRCPRAGHGDRFELAVHFDPEAEADPRVGATLAGPGLQILVARPDDAVAAR